MPKLDIKSILRTCELYKYISVAIVIGIAVLEYCTGIYTVSLGFTIFVCVAVFAVMGADVLTNIVFGNDKSVAVITKLLQLVLVMLMEHFCDISNPFWAITVLLSIMISIEYILLDVVYDNSSVWYRKFAVACIIMVFTVDINSVNLGNILYILFRIVSVLMIYYIADWFKNSATEYNSKLNSLYVNISDSQTEIERLKEYRERVKSINEQINYQKIDLTRINRDLAQINIETKAQAEIMKYMSSTFDIPKCVNVILETITEVKKPKLCAIYIDERVYNNPVGFTAIKTNYTSMQRRIKKDIEDIFCDYSVKSADKTILYNDDVKRFRFVGDTNLESMLIMPIRDGKTTYGLLIVASDEEGYFDSGISFYENCLIEFNISVKSTQLYLKTQDMARKDGLTGIFNRVYFGELFDKAVKHALLKESSLSVALLDIDKFKSVNDVYGHIAGDKVIKMVAGVAQKYADKNNGIACRYGGEEFLLVFPGKDEQESLQILEQFHEEIKSTKVVHEEKTIDVNVCIGLSSYPNICKNPEMLINRADISMYYGKRNGRGRLVLDNPLVDSVGNK